MTIQKSNCCGAPLIGGVQCAACGGPTEQDFVEGTVRSVIEAHDSLCLDVEEERETLIAALVNGLTEE